MKIRFIVGFIVVALFGLAYWFGLFDCLCIEQIKCHRQSLEDFVANYYAYSLFLYIALHAACVTFFLPLGSVLNTIAGFLFGTLIGGIAGFVAGLLGATASFILVRYLFKPLIQQTFAKHVRFFNHEMDEYGTYYLIGIHFVMGIPFALINSLAGLSHVRLTTFIWTTAVGTIPGSFIHAYVGYLLRSLETVSDIVSPRILALIIIIGVIAIASFILRRYKNFRVMQ